MGLGIDFGTTRTVVAAGDRGNYPVVSFESHTGDAVEWFPSVVAARGAELRFGFEAVAVAGDPDFTSLRSFKRLLAGREASRTERVDLGALRLTAAELIERFVVALAEALQHRSNLAMPLAGTAAVIAAPANAFCTQRFSTLEAFRAAGFAVRAMMNEPSAAGFEYTHRYANTLSARREHVVVYDLGGGTFDASLVRVHGTHHDVLATAGLSALGGDDFDAALAGLACRRAGIDVEALPPHARARLLDACRDAKEALNASSRRITIDLDEALGAGTGGGNGEVSVAVADFYEAVAPLVERTIRAMQPVLARSAGGELADVAGLYVVGGASALPVVGRMLRERFGRRVHRSPYPHASVAIGLAIASDADAGYGLADRFSRVFGVFREADGGAQASADAIFTRELALPRHAERVTVTRTYRAAHNVGRFRYFECEDLDASGAPRGELALLGEVSFPFDAALVEHVHLDAVPVRRFEGEGPLVDEEYAVDANGLVHVTMRQRDAGFERTFVVGGDAPSSEARGSGPAAAREGRTEAGAGRSG